MKIQFLLIILLSISISSICQDEKKHFGMGLSGGSLNAAESIASGFCFYFGKDIIQTKNSSISISTNIKLGTEDKSGFIFPANLLLAIIDKNYNGQYITIEITNFFFQLLFLIQYNLSLCSNS